MSMKTVVSQIVMALDKTDSTHLTRIVYNGEEVLFLTNHAGTDGPGTSPPITDEVDEWLRNNDPNARERN